MNKIKSRPSAEILSLIPYRNLMKTLTMGTKMPTAVFISVKSWPCAEILSLIPYPSLMSRIARTRISIPHLNIWWVFGRCRQWRNFKDSLSLSLSLLQIFTRFLNHTIFMLYFLLKVWKNPNFLMIKIVKKMWLGLW